MSKQVSVNFLPADTQAERDEKMAAVESMDKITSAQFTIERDTSKDEGKPMKTPEELLNSDLPQMQTAAWLYLEAKQSKATWSHVALNDCGVFGGADVHFIIKFPDHRRTGFRGRLKDLLVKWKLIEEF